MISPDISKEDVEEGPLVDGFLLGLPKCGTTWLTNILSQNPSIAFSEPKEPNIIATHRGTFGRTLEEPNLEEYGKVFSGGGFRVDGSVHAFSCPLAPERVFSINPESRFVVCLREPVQRAFSHWKMVKDNRKDLQHGCDWSEFKAGWGDPRLRDDSLWSESMNRWLKYFDIGRFLLIDSERMKTMPNSALREITLHFDLPEYQYDAQEKVDANTSWRRRSLTSIGSVFKGAIGLIPNGARALLARPLQKRQLNIYNLPIISVKGDSSELTGEHYNTCKADVVPDLVEFERITGFSTAHWVDAFD